MRPYYEQDGITIYHGDCREILPILGTRVSPPGEVESGRQLSVADVLVTDPPYIGMAGTVAHTQGGVGKDRRPSQTVRAVGDVPPANWLPLCQVRLGGFVFCSWHFVSDVRASLPGTPVNLFTWHKRNAPNPVLNRPKYTTEFVWAFELAPGLNWRTFDTSMFDIPNLTAGCVSTGERFIAADGRCAHPTQKPRDLMHLILRSVWDSPLVVPVVLDPFAGTGTTLHVARDMGLRAIGIEIEERYCEIAARRLDQTVLAL